LRPSKGRLLPNTLMNLALVEKDRYLEQGSAAGTAPVSEEHWRQAWHHLEEAQQMRRQALAADELSEADRFTLRSELAVGDYNRGMLEYYHALAGAEASPSTLVKAEEILQLALASLRQLIEEAAKQEDAPHDVLELTFDLAVASRALADLQVEAKASVDATVYDQAAKLIARLAGENPHVAEYQAEWVNLCRNQARAANLHGDPQLALACLNQAREILAQLANRPPQGAKWRRQLASVLQGIAILCEKLRRPAEAAEAARNMLTEIKRCLPEDKEDLQLRQQMRWAEARAQRGQGP